MAGDDDSRDDAERTRIGGLPPPIPKPPAGAAPAIPVSGDAGERTQIAPARPPGAPGAAAPRPPERQPAAEDQAERTRIVSGAPPRPIPAAPAPPAASEGGDRTQVVASPPPGSARAVPPPTPAAPPPAAARPAVAPPAAPVADVTVDPARGRPAADDEERTVVLTRRVECTVHLERVAPTGTAEVIDLDRPILVLGRGHGCDVKLRTPTASREHARVFFKDGRWTIAGIERRTFYVDGTRHAGGEIPLRGGMRVRLGDDEFVVIDDAGGSAAASGRGGSWARVVSFLRGLVGRRDRDKAARDLQDG